MRILQQDISEEGTAGAEDGLVCPNLLVIRWGQGDISKVLISPQTAHCMLGLSLEARVRDGDICSCHGSKRNSRGIGCVFYFKQMKVKVEATSCVLVISLNFARVQNWKIKVAVNHSLGDQGLVTLRGQKVDKIGKERAKKYNLIMVKRRFYLICIIVLCWLVMALWQRKCLPWSVNNCFVLQESSRKKETLEA